MNWASHSYEPLPQVPHIVETIVVNIFQLGGLLVAFPNLGK
jgi:hypothetical protein